MTKQAYGITALLVIAGVLMLSGSGMFHGVAKAESQNNGKACMISMCQMSMTECCADENCACAENCMENCAVCCEGCTACETNCCADDGCKNEACECSCACCGDESENAIF